MNESKAARYQRRQRRHLARSWAAGVVVLAVVALTPAGASLLKLSTRAASALPVQFQEVAALAFFLGFATAAGVLAAALVAPQQTTENTAGRWRAVAPTAAVLIPAVVSAGILMQVLIRVAGETWWLLVAVLSAVVLAAALRIGPRILGVGGAVRPVSRPGLAGRVEALAERAGVPVASVGEWRLDEPASTVAMVAGTGRQRQILLATDVVHDWSDDELLAVVAHELAHLVHNDLLRSLAGNVAVLAAGLLTGDLVIRGVGDVLGLGGVDDPRALTVIALSVLVVWMLATPLRLAQSRHQERRADRFALALTGRAEAFATAVRRAGARRLVDDRPTRIAGLFFQRHPSIAERLALAEQFRRESVAGE